MSYQVLARKWRPHSFKEIVGQPSVVRALTNALDQNRLHHAYLFTGTRGVGKTTIARLLAKCLNCQQGVTSNPCNTCTHCQMIDQGRFIDLLEIDAASRTKVEDTRELLENVQYLPTQGRYKVYLIDEVHMLSKHSFNALLKTLEEPPPHVKFLLATTDPDLPKTVLSRCLQFHLKHLSAEHIIQQLQHILQCEHIPYESTALQILAQAAQGSMRDALSLLDQAIAYGNGSVCEQEVQALLGRTKPELLLNLLIALSHRNSQEILSIVHELAQSGTDFSSTLEDFLSLIHRVALQHAIPELSNNPTNIIELAASLHAEEVQLFYQIGLIGRRDLPLAPTPRSGFEMILLRMLAFRPHTHSLPATNPNQAAQPSNHAPKQPTEIPATPKPSHHSWAELLPHLNLQGAALLVATNCVLIALTDHEVQLELDIQQAALLNKTLEQRITHALAEYFQKPITLKIKTGKLMQETPAMLNKQKKEQDKSEAVQAITNDSHVQSFMREFNAQIIPNSINTKTVTD